MRSFTEQTGVWGGYPEQDSGDQGHDLMHTQ